jgi:hypothetical protein
LVAEFPCLARLEARLAALVGQVERESALSVLLLRQLVAVQAGAGLLALADAAGARRG